MSLLRRSLERYGLKKSPESVIAESTDPSRSLKKSLGAFDLVILGVGGIIGAGIFVLVGLGAQTAGPNIIWAFVLAGFICALAGLAYAELASTIPTSGSAYAYAYSSLGETIAWTLGWALVLEYAVGSAAVAIGWSSNFVALWESVTGMDIPLWATASHEVFSGVEGGLVNIPAIVIVGIITTLLVVGSKATARFASVFVIAKVAILALVVGLGFFFISADNFSLAPPAPDPTEWYSILGIVGPVIGAAAVIFFAYIGFDAVSTTAEETKNPKRDLPIGILGSLAICTFLYILASAVLVGMVPYTNLSPDCSLVEPGETCIVGNGVTVAESAERLGEPFGYAVDAAGLTFIANLIRVGAIIGITSVLMVLLLGGPRVFFALARDGLLPQSWSKVSKFGTPARTTIGTGIGVALFAGFGTLGIAGRLTNIGTAFAFALVCVSVVVLRYTKPDLNRPFKVPLNIGRFPILAALGAVLCFGLMMSTGRATIVAFFGWMGLGLMFYALYGIRKSKLFGHVGRGTDASAPAPADGVEEART